MKYELGEQEIAEILEHWNSTPANSYRGSGYGENHNRLLFQPMSVDLADQTLNKLKNDIPMFANLPSDTIQILSEDLANDKKQFHLSVGSVLIPLSTTDNSNYSGDTIYANAQ
ncbi:hypothetical protein ACG9XL_17340 [Acinetobacter nosocomialis]|uniref:hypothetical protein n=1 Tax=Acinetobacter calcoaceticus/baumannii complex TaxID=909768 RepID=UPI0020CB9500|nr:hypothetical protein [Acinetobacter baumannii]HCA5286838.1 hypothetical protein [Acinetobacter nosocomialis]MCQ1072430.1 hypothetical protein [Acinetobacter baumannii]MDC5568461.1 hypothetical protein [Acinetobacter baumannii]MDI9759645.1 hypothetical protein [Acinetobacter baumannii]MDK2172908.1 hypothetical protein [Acinetobacter baumannii]